MKPLPRDHNSLLAQLDQARDRLDRQTDQLQVLLDWRDDLRRRLKRARFRAELIGADETEEDGLAAEAEDFKRCCKSEDAI